MRSKRLCCPSLDGGGQGSRSTERSAGLGTGAWSSASWSSPQITFDDVLSKFGSHIYGEGEGEGEESGEMGSIVEEGPSVLQDTQQFFTPQGRGAESRGGAEVPPGETIEETAHCKPMPKGGLAAPVHGPVDPRLLCAPLPFHYSNTCQVQPDLQAAALWPVVHFRQHSIQHKPYSPHPRGGGGGQGDPIPQSHSQFTSPHKSAWVQPGQLP